MTTKRCQYARHKQHHASNFACLCCKCTVDPGLRVHLSWYWYAALFLREHNAGKAGKVGARKNGPQSPTSPRLVTIQELT